MRANFAVRERHGISNQQSTSCHILALNNFYAGYLAGVPIKSTVRPSRTSLTLDKGLHLALHIFGAFQFSTSFIVAQRICFTWSPWAAHPYTTPPLLMTDLLMAVAIPPLVADIIHYFSSMQHSKSIGKMHRRRIQRWTYLVTKSAIDTLVFVNCR